jgi:hypothetical protein
MYLKLKHHFKSFDFKNKSKLEKKAFPFVGKCSEYELLVQYKYTIKEFRDILKRLHLPRCKETKRQKIQEYCTNMMFLSHKIEKMQRLWRNYFIRNYNKTLGPSYRNFHLSNNLDDFLTTEEIKDIDYYYYYSFRDKDNFVYTFNLVSISTLLDKNILKNPYNRNDFDSSIVEEVKRRIRYNNILKKISLFKTYTSQPTNMRDRVTQLFSHMDTIGNYTTNISWFLELNTNRLRRFLYELHEIWNYRADLPTSVKELICPPHGNPFSNLSRNLIPNYNNTRVFFSLNYMRQASLEVMGKLCYSAHSDANKNLGILYVLSALTLVSNDARDALPWLYASVYYN